MDPQNSNNELEQKMEERLKQLPQVVQDAIMSADVQKRLRALADTQKLHLDQWQVLENEVMLTLLGFQQIESLEKNIKDQVGVSAEIARILAESTNTVIFEPIRQELERQLEHPEAQEKKLEGVEAVRAQALAGTEGRRDGGTTEGMRDEGQRTDTESTTLAQMGPNEPVAQSAPTVSTEPSAMPVAPVVQPATPPQPASDVKVTRPSESTAYKPGETSAVRAAVHDDPYREAPI